MGFFGLRTKKRKAPALRFSEELLTAHGCTVCPLRDAPKLEPLGSNDPVIYILGEATHAGGASCDRHFMGAAGQLLDMHIPEAWEGMIRWNNCVRSEMPMG